MPQASEIAWLIPVFPLIGAVISGLGLISINKIINNSREISRKCMSLFIFWVLRLVCMQIRHYDWNLEMFSIKYKFWRSQSVHSTSIPGNPALGSWLEHLALGISGAFCKLWILELKKVSKSFQILKKSVGWTSLKNFEQIIEKKLHAQFVVKKVTLRLNARWQVLKNGRQNVYLMSVR